MKPAVFWTSGRGPTSRRRMVVGVAAGLVGLLTACGGSSGSSSSAGSGGSGSSPLFVAINKSADQQYFIALQQAFKAEIEKLGGRAKLYNAKLDTNLAINDVNDAISAGAKGIAITVPDQSIGPSVASIASQAKVALAITDDLVKNSAGNQLPFVGFSGTDMGKKVGTEASQLLSQLGWLSDSSKKVGVLSVEVQTLSVCNDRTTAEKSQVESAGVPAGNVFPVPYSGETSSAQGAAGPVITAHPNITNWIVFACNDEGVVGALNALTTAGAQASNIIAVGLGAYLACVPWHANQASGFKAALYISGADVGRAAADELWNFVTKNTALPLNTYAKTTIVTPQTYATTIAKADAPACFS
jgi:L-arabinose transport system substrate-binding protein